MMSMCHNKFCVCGRPLDNDKCLVCDADELLAIRLREERFEEEYHERKHSGNN